MPAGLFALAFIIRFFYAVQIVFPPLDDPAYYIQGARSILAGHPLQLDITWNYFPAFETVRRPGFDFWMPLTSFLMAGMFALLGDSLLAAQLPGVLGGALLAPLTFWLAGRFFSRLEIEAATRRKLSFLSGLYIALNPLLAYQSAVPDSQMIYAPLVAVAALLVANPASQVQSQYDTKKPLTLNFRFSTFDFRLSTSFLFGLALGLAYITRSHAVFLGLAWALVMGWRLLKRPDDRLILLKQAGLTLLGLTLTAGPWILRTWFTFGFLNSPAGLQSALIYQYPTLFNYETPINFTTFARLGLDKIIEARVNALVNAWQQVLSVMFLPTVALPLAGLVLLWRKTRMFSVGLLYCLLLSLGLPLIFVAASSTGSFYHSAGSLATFGATGLVYLLWLAGRQAVCYSRSGRPVFMALVLIVLLLEIAQFALSVNSTVQTHRYQREVYARLDAWLKANNGPAPVIADEPSTLNYATGLPGLRLPSDEPLEVVQRLARRYGARYLVVTNSFGRYPALLQSPENKLMPLAYKDPQQGFEIYSAGL